MDKHHLFQQFVAFTTNLHQVTQALTQNVKLDHITALQYKILEYIKVSQAVTATEISDCLHMSLPNTSRELRKLQERQLIEKTNDQADRRKQVIRLTLEGDKMMTDVFNSIEENFSQLLHSVSPEDVEAISGALTLLEEKLFQHSK
ncbi:MarR family winged helix-turn-helix transcriptional regulator [Metasolibacillus sp.]|uniref:MarR family winged helix-turn-helix transcriptional regulator n=1 Tax=Metasolibacillus sp. TaxID=2703680 RepID=UPI0025D8CBF6|nr:MarR family winged helix-turn-helix transcriptional regulator [Metasolibacillus sp.]MCT6922874.1 MarR family winged helix-turn-helix transcriptional regulator [Metasolibacillus sp.]MCT6938787.1 MarR family winged helix-turn-helix transcriptional regulator [Metasolibacillus sp.]